MAANRVPDDAGCALLPGDRVVNGRTGEHAEVITAGAPFVMVLADDGVRLAWAHGDVTWEEGGTLPREAGP